MASTHPNGLLFGMQSGQILDDSDIEAELEVDQLDSDTDPEEQVAITKATSKNGATRPGERVPGHTLLPAVRLENMIQADGAVILLQRLILPLIMLRCNWQLSFVQGRAVCSFNCHGMQIYYLFSFLLANSKPGGIYKAINPSRPPRSQCSS